MSFVNRKLQNQFGASGDSAIRKLAGVHGTQRNNTEKLTLLLKGRTHSTFKVELFSHPGIELRWTTYNYKTLKEKA